MATQRDRYEIDFSQVMRDAAKAALSLAALKATLLDSVKAAVIQEKADADLARALRNTGHEVENNLRLLKQQASAIQDVSIYGDEFTQQLMAQALGLGVSADRLDLVTRLSIGLANATGKDLRSAFTQVVKQVTLGKAEWSEFGLVIAKGEEGVRQLSERFLDFVAHSGSFAERAKQLQNGIGDFQEQIGFAVIKIEDLLFRGGGEGGLMGELTQWTKNLVKAMDTEHVRSFWDAMLTGAGQTAMQQLALDLLAMEERREALLNANPSHADPDKIAAEIGALSARIEKARERLAAMTELSTAPELVAPPRPNRPEQGKPSAADAEFAAREATSAYRQLIAAMQEQNTEYRAGLDATEALRLADLERTRAELQSINSAREAWREYYAERRRLGLDAESIEKQSADELAQVWNTFSTTVVGGFGQMAVALGMAAARGGSEWEKMIGSQLMAQGLQWLISAPVHGLMGLLDPRYLPLAAAEAAQGAVAMAVGAGLGGSLSGGRATGGGGRGYGGGRSSAMHDTPARSSAPAEPQTITQIVYLQGGMIVHERDAMRAVRDADGRFALGTRHGSRSRSPFA